MRTRGVRAPTSVEEYFDRVPPQFRKVLGELRKTIRAAAPDAEELISYQMPAFRQDGMLVYYGAFRDHLSFFAGSARVLRQFSDATKPFEKGKGTLQFTPDRPLPSDLVRRIVRARVAENLARRSR
ncbi:MAG: DUF1801 domain-containing protein [Thermoplasmata archaeon]|nr:DUF1801 domain-containing protein [Thermoplasmata archaeon]